MYGLERFAFYDCEKLNVVLIDLFFSEIIIFEIRMMERTSNNSAHECPQ